MNEEYKVNEISDVTPEMGYVPEENPELNIAEHADYERSEGNTSTEFQDYESTGLKNRSRHTTVMRKNSNRLGRLMSLLSAVTAPAIVAIIIMATSIFADVVSFAAGPDSLAFNFKIYSSSEDTHFYAVLYDTDVDEKLEFDRAEIFSESPYVEFRGLESDRVYLLEVIAENEVRLSKTYKTLAAGSNISFTEEGQATGFDWVNVFVRAEGVDTEGLRAFIGDVEAELSVDQGMLFIKANGLEQSTKYDYSIVDEDGNVLFEGSFETSERAHAVIDITSFSSWLSGANMTFSLSNPDNNDLTFKLDGGDCSPEEATADKLVFSINDLPENSKHILEFFDYDGSKIFFYEFATRAREGASVDLTSTDFGFDSAVLTYSISNPDDNVLKLTFDGQDYDADLTSDSVTLSFTGLNMGEQHTLVFTDQNGDVICTTTFSAKVRTAATVEMITAEGKYDTVYGASTGDVYSFCIRATYKYTNPDNNDIKVTVNGNEVTPEYQEGTAILRVDNLDPGTAYEIVFTDYDGTELLKHTVETPARTPIEVSTRLITPGFSTATVSLNITNPHRNNFSLSYSPRPGSSSIEENNGTLVISMTGLSPRTAYSITIHDNDTDADVFTVTVTTLTSVKVTQDRSKNATFDLTDEFKAEYPTALLTVSDSLGYKITTSPTYASTSFSATAADIIYAGSYRIVVTSGGKTVDTLIVTLTGETRPVFTARHNAPTPATLSTAKETGSSSTIDSEFYYKFTTTGYIPESSSNETLSSALIFTDSSGNVASVSIEGMADTNISSQPTEESNLYIDINDSTFVAGKTYTMAIYVLKGYTEDQFWDMIYQDGKKADYSTVGKLFLEKGRPVNQTSVKISNPVNLDYAVIFGTEPERTPVAGSYVINPRVYYYSDYSGQGGYFTVVKASSPTVHAITPISLGTECASKELGEISLNFDEPYYAIIYYGSFTPSHFLFVNYEEP